MNTGPQHGTAEFATALLRHRLVAILRGTPDAQFPALIDALVAGGIRLIEVSLSEPAALEQVRLLRQLAPADVHVGAGTVVNAGLAAAAGEHGAGFLVTPHVVPAVIRYAAEHNLGMLCGAMTPTDIAMAREAGARFIKLFPAATFGPGYVRQLLGPYPDLELFVVGGVGSANLAEYMKAGALGAGVGGALAVKGGGAEEIAAARREAAALVEVIASG